MNKEDFEATAVVATALTRIMESRYPGSRWTPVVEVEYVLHCVVRLAPKEGAK